MRKLIVHICIQKKGATMVTRDEDSRSIGSASTDSDADELIIVYRSDMHHEHNAAIVGAAPTTHTTTTIPRILPSLTKNFKRNTTNDIDASSIIEIDDDDNEYNTNDRRCSPLMITRTEYTTAKAANFDYNSSDDESLLSNHGQSKNRNQGITANVQDCAGDDDMDDDRKLPAKITHSKHELFTCNASVTSLTSIVNLSNDTDDDSDENDRVKAYDTIHVAKSLPKNAPTTSTFLTNPIVQQQQQWRLGTQLSSSSSGDELSNVNTSNHEATSLVPILNRKNSIDICISSDDDSDNDSLDEIKSKLNLKSAVPKVRNTYDAVSVSALQGKATKVNPNRKQKETNNANQTNVLNTKQQQKELQQIKRTEERLQKQIDKENVKQSKQMERERQRLDKKNAIEAEKIMKKRSREERQQISGKLANKEIAVLLQKDLFTSSYTVIRDLENMGYHVQDHPSAFQCNAIQWIRMDALQGGAELAVQNLSSSTAQSSDGGDSEYYHFPILTVLVDDAPKFLRLLERSTEHSDDGNDDDNEDDYPALEEWLKGIEYGWRAAWKVDDINTETNVKETQQVRPRLILLLVRITEELDKMWIQYRKAISLSSTTTNGVHRPPPTTEELHDAITWILIQFQIECVHCKSHDDVSVQICKVTRLLAESPYKKPITEFACIKKIKPYTNFDDDDETTILDRAKDCWMRQLQQLPNVSQPRAYHLVQHYPTPLSLWIAYQNPNLSIAEKRNLVAHCFHPTKCNYKLANMLYTVMTSQNPDEIIH